MANLFDPLVLRGVTVRNRIGVSPMCQYSSEDGKATDWHLVHLGSRAVGGAGIILAEATAVEPRGRISPGDAGLWSDEQIAPLQRINKFVRSTGAVIGVQLAHAGRKASASRPWEGDAHLADAEGGWSIVAPSAVPFGGLLPKMPRELSVGEIQSITGKFAEAAARAVQAEYQLIEIHSAHGYLSHSFLSPISNKREDQYGGSFTNRVRFLRETVTAIRTTIPDTMPLFVRISASDWSPEGWTIEDSIALAKLLKGDGVDLIDCSSGFIDPDYRRIPFGSGFQIPFSERIRHEAALPTATVGLITSAAQADEIIRNGRADIVLLGREMLRDPYWPTHAARALGKNEQLKLPIQYSHWLK